MLYSNRNSHTVLVGLYKYFGNLYGYFLKLNFHLPQDPGIIVPDIYPREIKAYVHRKTYM